MLLFSSFLRLREVPGQVSWEKIFSWTAVEGVRLYAQRSDPDFRPAFSLSGGWESSASYHIKWPSMSGDGHTVALTKQNDCSFGTPCTASIERWQTTIRFEDGIEKLYGGSAQLSANGQFALLQSSKPFGIEFAPNATWVNTGTGQSEATSSYYLPAKGSHPIADDGTTVRWSNLQRSTLELWRPGFGPFLPTVVKALPGFYLNTQPVLLSADGRIAVAATTSLVLAAYLADTATVETIPATFGSTATDISEDGSVLLVRTSDSYRIIRRDGSGSRTLSLDTSVTEAVLSGDGNVVFALIRGERIVRVDVATGQITEIVPTTFYDMLLPLDGVTGTIGQGSLLRLLQAELPGRAATAAQFDEQVWPFVNPTSVQVPWDFPLDHPPAYLHLVLKPTSAGNVFEDAMIFPVMKIMATGPQLLAMRYPECQPSPRVSCPPFTSLVIAAHQDFGSPVSASSPARPGETIHVYGTGFGEVSPPVRTGEPAPVGSVSPLTSPVDCSLTLVAGGPYPLEVQFAGLAPGMIGVDQLDLRLPSVFPGAASAGIMCRVGESFTALQMLPLAGSAQ